MIAKLSFCNLIMFNVRELLTELLSIKCIYKYVCSVMVNNKNISRILQWFYQQKLYLQIIIQLFMFSQTKLNSLFLIFFCDFLLDSLRMYTYISIINNAVFLSKMHPAICSNCRQNTMKRFATVCGCHTYPVGKRNSNLAFLNAIFLQT